MAKEGEYTSSQLLLLLLLRSGATPSRKATIMTKEANTPHPPTTATSVIHSHRPSHIPNRAHRIAKQNGRLLLRSVLHSPPNHSFHSTIVV
uniref:Putative secreted protein n=1 Tax=Anopheles triannulatus TaxID=58253 RepID=A0A2M4B853_9DIPT